ncbi:MAG: Ig-like domain-containing protein [Bacteroidales bacterium]
MRKHKVTASLLLILLASVVLFTQCKKDDETTFILNSLVSGTIDMNGATPPNNVSTNPTIVATFSVDVDPASVSSANVILNRTYDNVNLALTVAVSGATITITPNEVLGTGSQFKLTFPAINSTDGQSIPGFNRTFTTEGTFAPAGVVAHWNFENNANDQAGANNASAVVDILYQDSRNTTAGKAAFFNGTSSIIEIPNGDVLYNTHDFTLSFWVKTKSDGHLDAGGNPKGHFVIGLGAFKGFQFEIPGDYGSCKMAASYELADGSTASEDLWFNGSGEYNGNGGWQGWTFCQNLTGSGGVAALLKDKWAHVVLTYNGTTKIGTMYINGERMKAQDFNLWPAGDPKQGVQGMKWGGVAPEVYPTIAFGFIQSREGTMWAGEPWGGYNFPTSNHFGGWLDDIRIFHKAITETEVSLMYQSEKP